MHVANLFRIRKIYSHISQAFPEHAKDYVWTGRLHGQCYVTYGIARVMQVSVRHYSEQGFNSLFGRILKSDPGRAEALVFGEEVEAILFAGKDKGACRYGCCIRNR